MDFVIALRVGCQSSGEGYTQEMQGSTWPMGSPAEATGCIQGYLLG